MADVLQATSKVTGSITTQNLVPAGVATAGSAVEIALGGKQDTLAIQVTGTYTGVLSVQGSVDGTNWVTRSGASDLTKNDAVATATIPSAAVGIWKFDVSAYGKCRVTGLAAMTGTAVVTLLAGIGSQS